MENPQVLTAYIYLLYSVAKADHVMLCQRQGILKECLIVTCNVNSCKHIPQWRLGHTHTDMYNLHIMASELYTIDIGNKNVKEQNRISFQHSNDLETQFWQFTKII